MDENETNTVIINPADSVLGVETKACVNGLTKTNAEDVKQIPTIRTNVETLNTQIESVSEDVGELKDDVSGLSDSVLNNTNGITQLNTQMESVSEDIDNLENSITTINNTTIPNINQTLQDLDQSITYNFDEILLIETAMDTVATVIGKGFYLAPYTMTNTDFLEYRNGAYFAIRDIVIVTYFRSTATQFGIKTVFLPKGGQLRDITGGYISIDYDNNTITIYHGRISASSINNLINISAHYSNFTFNIDTVDIANSTITHTTQAVRYNYNSQVDTPSICIYIRDDEINWVVP